MSDLASGLDPGRDRARRRGSLGALAVLVPLTVAVIVSAPRIWKSVRTEPSASIAVASLPAPQPAAATQLPLEQSPRPSRGQLATLGRFVARDPFASPLPAPAVPASPAAAASPVAPATVAAPAPVAPVATSGSAPAASDPSAGLAPDAAASAAGLTTAAASPDAALASGIATIAVNGIPEAVALRELFPAADPLFRLVAFGAGEVQIGVVGASSPGGEQTVTLVRDRPLTLLDTASGGRYELRLVSVS